MKIVREMTGRKRTQRVNPKFCIASQISESDAFYCTQKLKTSQVRTELILSFKMPQKWVMWAI